jgi:putative hemolysin
MKKTPSIFTVISIIIVALIAVGCAQTKVENPPAGNTPDNGGGTVSPIACTMEAKSCPDGSAVGRSGPKCEFTPCPGTATTPEQVAIANPASQNCLKQGGKLEMRNNKLGQYGVCYFEDNRQCEEWALLRGNCPVGGLKITGYGSDAEIYCAITGGKVENSDTGTLMCRRTDGTLCATQANLDGQCPDPGDPNPNSGNVEAP